MEAASINTNNDPGIWEQQVALLKSLHVFISRNFLAVRNIIECFLHTLNLPFELRILKLSQMLQRRVISRKRVQIGQRGNEECYAFTLIWSHLHKRLLETTKPRYSRKLNDSIRYQKIFVWHFCALLLPSFNFARNDEVLLLQTYHCALFN
jgi:hypothetical protein